MQTSCEARRDHGRSAAQNTELDKTRAHLCRTDEGAGRDRCRRRRAERLQQDAADAPPWRSRQTSRRRRRTRARSSPMAPRRVRPSLHVSSWTGAGAFGTKSRFIGKPSTICSAAQARHAPRQPKASMKKRAHRPADRAGKAGEQGDAGDSVARIAPPEAGHRGEGCLVKAEAHADAENGPGEQRGRARPCEPEARPRVPRRKRDWSRPAHPAPRVYQSRGRPWGPSRPESSSAAEKTREEPFARDVQIGRNPDRRRRPADSRSSPRRAFG